MLNCKHLVENTSEYLEGDMTRWQRMKVKMHLLMCRSCSRYVKQVKQTIALLGRLKPTQPSQEMQNKLTMDYQRLMEEQQK